MWMDLGEWALKVSICVLKTVPPTHRRTEQPNE